MKFIYRLTFCLFVTFLSHDMAFADYIGSETCTNCHQNEWQSWMGSDHQLSMAEADEMTVLGDFNNREIRYRDIVSHFRQEDGKFFVTTDNAEGEMEEFQITHTFGIYPLQQYLISFDDGRKQALNLAWDTRPESQGGQRWFNLYNEDDIEAGDLLHWTSFPFTWNTSCAGCHSTNLEKNYDPSTNQFHTSWSEINVSCEACHGEGSGHMDWLASPETPMENSGFPWSLETAGGWSFTELDNPIASRIPADAPAPFEPQVCAQCHSLRSELQPFAGNYHDAFQLSPVTEPQYHIDGQIREEVFVMGSFAQSAMHDAGVTCSNCHDPHSLKLIAEPNQVCAQCHMPTTYDSPEHHYHETGSAGALCVDCHMPASNFMVIDARRDHNIRVPRPDLSVELGTPNACNQCHIDESVDWAAEHFSNWWPQQETHYSEYLVEATENSTTRLSRLFSVLAEPDTNAIARYRILEAIAQTSSTSAFNAIRGYTRSDSVIEKQGAINALSYFPLEQTRTNLLPLLEDPHLSVRLAATKQLAALPPEQLSPAQQQNLQTAILEAEQKLQAQLDSPGAAMQLSNLYAASGDLAGALNAIEQALTIAPDWLPALLNKASLLSSSGNEDAARASLRQAISAHPGQAAPYYALALAQIRTQERDAALLNLERAANLAPENAHYSYVYGIALYESGEIERGINRIFSTYQSNPAQTYIGLAAASYQIQLGLFEQARQTSRILAERAPENPQVQQILQYLQQIPVQVEN